MHRAMRLTIVAVVAVVAVGAVLAAPIVVGSAPRPAHAAPAEALLIGDSVMAAFNQGYGAPARALLASRHSYLLEAAGCRRLIGPSCRIGSSPAPTNAITVLSARAGQFDRALVVAVGYNDSNIGGAVDTIIAEARRQQIPTVIWLTYREAGSSALIAQLRRNNAVLHQKASEYDELRLADWAGASAGLPTTWFSADGVHLGGAAATAMARLIADALDNTAPDRCAAPSWQGEPAAVGAGAMANPAGGVHVLTTPVRLLDSRSLAGKVGAGRVVTVPVAGTNGVPPDAAAAIVTITSVGSCMAGFLTVFACGTAVPTASVVNAEADTVVANSAVVGLSGGAFCVYSSQPTDVVIDLTAWIGTLGASTALFDPVRLVDTRPGQAEVLGVVQQRLGAGAALDLDVGSMPGVATSATGVTVNLTAAAPAGDGFLTALPGRCTSAALGPAGPATSNVNVSAGHDAAAAATVGVVDGHICVYSSVDTDVVVDLDAVHGEVGPLVAPITPARALDTRIDGRMHAGEVRPVDLDVVPGAPPALAGAVVNVTAVGPAGAGYVRVHSCSLASGPTVSNLNVMKGVTVANRATVATDAEHRLCVYTSTDTDVVIDVEAWVS